MLKCVVVLILLEERIWHIESESSRTREEESTRRIERGKYLYGSYEECRFIASERSCTALIAACLSS